MKDLKFGNAEVFSQVDDIYSKLDMIDPSATKILTEEVKNLRSENLELFTQINDLYGKLVSFLFFCMTIFTRRLCHISIFNNSLH
jgi:hypothetical protein